MADREKFTIAARILILDGDKVLMGFEPMQENGKGNHWETPGGGIEKMETVAEGLKREAKEEIGTDIVIEDRMPFIFKCMPKELSPKIDSAVIVIYFICTPVGKPDLEKATDKEFHELKYMGEKDFEELSEQRKIMFFDRKFIPLIMKSKKLW